MDKISNQIESAAPRLLALFIVALVLMGFKSPDSLSLPQLWAEDGVVFFSQQYNHIFPQVFTPYAGYLHAIPRLVAWLASAFSPTRIPMVYNAVTLMISAFCVAYTSKRFDPFVPWPVVLLSFYIVAAGGEIFGTLTNVQWFTQFALVAACILPAADKGRLNKLGIAVLILLVSLTGPFSIFVFVPVILLHSFAWIGRRTPAIMRIPLFSAFTTASKSLSFTRIAALFSGALIQAGYLVLSNSRAPHNSKLNVTQLVTTTFGDVLPLHIFGQHYLTTTAWLTIFSLLVFLVATHRDAESKASAYILILIALASVFALAGTAANDLDGTMSFGFSDRYFYFSKLIFWWALYFSLSSKANREQTTIFVIGAMAFFAIINGHLLQRGVFKDLHWKEDAGALIQPGHHEILINPSWTMSVTTESREKPHE